MTALTGLERKQGLKEISLNISITQQGIELKGNV